MADVTFVPDFSAFIAEVERLEARQSSLKNLTESFGKSGAQAYTNLERAAAKAAKGPSTFAVAMESTAKSSASTAAGMQQLSFQLNDVVTQLASGANPMQVFAQQGGQIVGAFQTAPGLFSALSSGIASAATVGSQLLIPFLAVAGPLWYDYRTATEAAAAGQAAFNTALEDSEPLIDRALREQRKLSELRRGSMTIDERKAEAERQYRDDLDAANRVLEESIATNEAWLQQNTANQAGWAERKAAVNSARKAIEENTKTAETGIETAKLLLDYEDESEKSSRQIAEAKKREAESRKRAAERAAEEADALREHQALIERVNQLEAQRRSALDSQLGALDQIAEKNRLATMSEEDRIQAEADAQRDAAQTAMMKAKSVAESAEERERIERAYLEALRAINAEELADYEELKAKKAEADEKAARERLRREHEYVGAVADVTGSASDLFGAYYDHLTADADKMSAEQKRTALNVWRAQQSLAIAEIGINTIKGVSAALASAPPPANLIPAAVAAAQGAAQIAAASASPPPIFDDTPGAVYAATGRRVQERAQVSLHRDDIMIAGKTPESVVAQAAGMTAQTRRQRLGPQLARVPVGRLLTSDVERATRGRLPR